jgi:hypothetical protein
MTLESQVLCGIAGTGTCLRNWRSAVVVRGSKRRPAGRASGFQLGRGKSMKKLLGMVIIAIAAVALLGQDAEAKSRRVDPRVTAAGLGVGLASTAGFFALNNWRTTAQSTHFSGLGLAGAYAVTSVACIAIAPLVASAVVNRPLTQREFHVLGAGCIVPIVGPLLVNAAYDAHPEWEGRRIRRR